MTTCVSWLQLLVTSLIGWMTLQLTLSYWVQQSLSKIINTFLLFGNVLNMFPIIQITTDAMRNRDSVLMAPSVNRSGQPPDVSVALGSLAWTAMNVKQVTMATHAVSTVLILRLCNKIIDATTTSHRFHCPSESKLVNTCLEPSRHSSVSRALICLPGLSLWAAAW